MAFSNTACWGLGIQIPQPNCAVLPSLIDQAMIIFFRMPDKLSNATFEDLLLEMLLAPRQFFALFTPREFYPRRFANPEIAIEGNQQAVKQATLAFLAERQFYSNESYKILGTSMGKFRGVGYYSLVPPRHIIFFCWLSEGKSVVFHYPSIYTTDAYEHPQRFGVGPTETFVASLDDGYHFQIFRRGRNEIIERFLEALSQKSLEAPKLRKLKIEQVRDEPIYFSTGGDPTLTLAVWEEGAVRYGTSFRLEALKNDPSDPLQAPRKMSSCREVGDELGRKDY